MTTVTTDFSSNRGTFSLHLPFGVLRMVHVSRSGRPPCPVPERPSSWARKERGTDIAFAQCIPRPSEILSIWQAHSLAPLSSSKSPFLLTSENGMNHPTGSSWLRPAAPAPTPRLPERWAPSDGRPPSCPTTLSVRVARGSRSGKGMDTTRFRHPNAVSSSDPKDRTDSVPTMDSTRSASPSLTAPVTVAVLNCGTDWADVSS